jgi:hypothetical protein
MRYPYWIYLFLAMVAVLAAIAMTASATDWPSGLNVTSHTELANDADMNVYGDIVVRSGGHLDITNCDITMRCTSDGEYTIRVESGGRLSFNGGSIKANNPAYRYKIVLRDNTALNGVTIRDTWGSGTAFNSGGTTDPPLSGLKGGVQIYTDSVDIDTCTFERGLLCLVYVEGASPRIGNSTFRNVTYDVRSYATTSGVKHWSAMAFGILLNNADTWVYNNKFFDIGKFDTIFPAYDLSVDYHNYYIIAAGVGSRNSVLDIRSNTVANTGVLTQTSRKFIDSGRNITQTFALYRVAGIYAYRSDGADLRGNNIQASSYGMYITVDTSATGPAMTFDVIIDNVAKRNDMGGIRFVLGTVIRDVTINVSDNDMDRNGVGTTSALEDCGLVVTAVDCSGDLTIILTLNNMRNNIGRGAFLDIHNHRGDLTVEASNSNNVRSNGAAGLLIILDTISGDVSITITNSTFVQNRPADGTDNGAIAIQGGTATPMVAAFHVKLADMTVTDNIGNGFGVLMGSIMNSPNQATSTSYTIHESQFNGNSDHGIYLYDNYATNTQQAVFDWKGIKANQNRRAIYVHSHSSPQLGNINFRLNDLVVQDNQDSQTAVRFEMVANTYTPRTNMSAVSITYSGTADSATGLSLQGDAPTHRWKVNMYNVLVAPPRTALEVYNCDVKATECNFTGEGILSVRADDSYVRLYHSDVPEGSATVIGDNTNVGVFFYRYLNISLIAWQNGEPIRNKTITIRRYNAPQGEDDVYVAKTDGMGDLPDAMVPYWYVDLDVTLRNDQLQAFLRVVDGNLNSLAFEFERSRVGIEDPRTPELVVNTPSENSVQKSGTINIQGTIRDTHSGVRYVEVTLDNIVWIPATGFENKVGKTSAGFEVPITDLGDGVYTVTVRGWDVARYPNESLGVSLLIIKNVKVDTEPPFLQIEFPKDPFFVTNNGSVTLVGRTEKASNIERITINDKEVLLIGNTFEYTSPLVEGTNTFVIIAEDTAGNIQTRVRQVVLDTMAPTLIITAPIHGFSSRFTAFDVSGDTEEDAEVSVKLNKRAWEVITDRGGTRFYHVLNMPKEGVHTITIRAEDRAGNIAEEAINVKYDVTPPVIDLEAPLPGIITNQQRVYVAGMTDPEVSRITVNGLIFEVINGQFALEINLLEGFRELVVELEDAAGNYNSTSVELVIDLTPPMIVDLTIQSTEQGSEALPLYDGIVVNEQRLQFRGRLEQGDIRNLYIRVGLDNRSALFEPGYVFWREFNLAEGENIVTFSAIDNASNRQTLRYIVVIDTKSPDIQFYSPSMGNNYEVDWDKDTIVVSGVVREPGSTLMIDRKQVPLVPATGAFQVTVPLSPGLNNIEVVFSDAAGNEDNIVMRITFEEEDEEGSSIGRALGALWWVFAILIALIILVPLTVHRVRNKWVRQHPELEHFDAKKARSGFYEEGYLEEDEYYYEDQYRGGDLR